MTYLQPRVWDQLVRFMLYLIFDHFSPDLDPTSSSVCVWNMCVFLFFFPSNAEIK